MLLCCCECWPALLGMVTGGEERQGGSNFMEYSKSYRGLAEHERQWLHELFKSSSWAACAQEGVVVLRMTLP